MTTSNIEIHQIALTVFVTIQVQVVVGLIFDAFLYFTGRKTITEYVWSDGALGIPILFFYLCGFVALAIHYYWR